MNSPCVPDSGDVVWLQFDPDAGHNQFGHRPALAFAPARYNSACSMMICGPMTWRVKGYVFEAVVT